MAYTSQSGKLIQFLATDNAINILCNAQQGQVNTFELTFKNLNLGGGTIKFQSLQVNGYGEGAVSDNSTATLYKDFGDITPSITTEGTYSIKDIQADALQIIVTGGTSPTFDLIIANKGSQKYFLIEKI